MASPDLSWRGTGYLDMNWGRVPLEDTFVQWDWMRVDLGGGNSAILYETEEVAGSGLRLALLSRPDGSIERIKSPARHRLPGTLWRVPRAGWSDAEPPRVTRTLEDTPFYVRTELSTHMRGARRTAIQESLSLQRFKSPVVKLLLPFRMPRITR
jgi:carotenoid 1,2-hydratase